MKRFPALLLLALLGACDSSSGPEPVRGLDILLGAAQAADQTIVAGSTLQLRANVTGPSGQTLSGRAVSWRSTIATVASVDTAGLVTGLTAGSTLIIASAEGASDTTRVTVTAPVAGAPTCAPGDLGLSLTVGQVRTFTAAEAATICLSGGAIGSEYTYIPFNASTTAQNLAIEIVAGGVIEAQGPPNPSRGPALGGPSLALGETRENWSFHRRLRVLEREMLARGGGLRGTALRSLSAAAVPSVGDRVRLSGDPDATCSAPDLRTGTVEVVSDHAIVVTDSLNSAGGLTRVDLQGLASFFDEVTWPVITAAMGDPSDIDDNDRVVLFFTRAVNDLTPEGSNSFVGGFFHPRDLNPNTGPQSCAASNFGEVLYMLTPDTARASGNVASPFSRAEILDSSPGVIAHELQHVINASSRRRRDVGGEEVWLNEGLSHIAEELIFYAVSEAESEQNLDVDALRASENVRTAFNSHQTSNFGRFIRYLEEPEDQSLIGIQDDDDLPTRGASWAFLRYAADRKADGQAAKYALWMQLVNSPSSGLTNLERVLGVDAVQWMQDWTTSVYTDDSGLPTEARYQQPSWNFRDILGVLMEDTGGFPLRTIPLAAGAPGVEVSRLQGGGAAFLRFGIPANGSAAIRATSGGAAPPERLRISIVRTR